MHEPSFLWYDFETFGTSGQKDLPCQFAAIRTDLDFNIIGKLADVPVPSLNISEALLKPFSVMISSIKYNFYPLLAITIVFIVIFTKKDIGSMKNAEKRTKETGELMNKGSKPMVSDEITSFPPKKGIEAKAYNMIVPLLTMVFMMPINLIYTGWSSVENATSFSNHASEAIRKGSGSSSDIYAVITALLVAMVMYFVQGIMKPKEAINLTLKGISE